MRNSPSLTIIDCIPAAVRIVIFDVVLGIGMKWRLAHSALIIVHIAPVSIRNSGTGMRIPTRPSISPAMLARRVRRIGPTGSESRRRRMNGTRKEEMGDSLNPQFIACGNTKANPSADFLREMLDQRGRLFQPHGQHNYTATVFDVSNVLSAVEKRKQL